MNNVVSNILFIGNGFDLQHKEMPKILFNEFINWAKNHVDYKRYIEKYFSISDYKETCSESMLWSELEDFLKKSKYINSKLKNKRSFYIKINEIFHKWMEIKIKDIGKIKVSKNEKIENLLIENNIKIILSFNYTETSKIYCFTPFNMTAYSNFLNFDISSFRNKFVNLHFFKEKKSRNYILGHDDEEQYNKNYLISSWTKNEKKYNVKEIFLKSLENNLNLIKKIVFYGFSFGKSDSEITKMLLKCFFRKREIKIIIFYYEDNFNILNNIKEILKNKKGVRDFIEGITWKK